MTNFEISRLYELSKDKDEEVFIIAELTDSDPETIIEVLKDEGVYDEKCIQTCIKCKEMYIEKGRAHICPSCKSKAKRRWNYARKSYHKVKSTW